MEVHLELKDIVEISKRNWIESPFTMIHPEDVRGIFNAKEIDEIIELTNKVLATFVVL